MQLRLLLLKLLQLGLQLAGKDYVVHLCVSLHLACQLVELVVEILPIHYNQIMLFHKLSELLLDLDDLLANGDQLALVVLSTHLMLLELSQQ